MRFATSWASSRGIAAAAKIPVGDAVSVQTHFVRGQTRVFANQSALVKSVNLRQ